AQTAAVGFGYALCQKNEPVQQGYIGAIQNLKIVELPGIEKIITTTVTITNVVMGVKMIFGVIQLGDKQIASCDMKLFLQNS
ncbi:MAG: 3-hydroxyacyl-ACP dehydratase, partial [SAR324 cluster bacterium]|nr:3-hydroxyacyl-ACP dehydratase [SAR324 cluster bacterium]